MEPGGSERQRSAPNRFRVRSWKIRYQFEGYVDITVIFATANRAELMAQTLGHLESLDTSGVPRVVRLIP